MRLKVTRIFANANPNSGLQSLPPEEYVQSQRLG